MSVALTLTQVEDSLGIALPDEVLKALKLKGDSLYLVQTQDGFLLTSVKPRGTPEQTSTPS